MAAQGLTGTNIDCVKSDTFVLSSTCSEGGLHCNKPGLIVLIGFARLANKCTRRNSDYVVTDARVLHTM